MNLFGRGRVLNRKRPETVRGWLVIPAAGNVFITDAPFDSSLTSIVQVGDRFIYPDSHAQAGEVYAWDGDSWEFEAALTAAPTTVKYAIMVLPSE